jgi:hypothetical protein
MIKRLITFAILVILLSACSSELHVLTSYDDNADFTSYLTFGVVNYDTSTIVSGKPLGFVDIYFKSAIEDQMKERGYILSDNRDLEIYYYVKIDTESEMVTSYYPSYGGYYGGGYYGYYGGYGYGPVGVGIGVGGGGVGVGVVGYGGGGYSMEMVDHSEGTLIIDIVDVRSNSVVWQGTAKKSIDKSKGGDQREISHIIDRVFNDYRWTVGTVAEAEAEKKKK